MKSELILVAALSGAALLIGNAATAAVMAAGSSEGDLVSTAMDLAAQGAIPSMDPLRVRRLARMGQTVGAQGALPQGRGARERALGDGEGDRGVLG